MATVSEGPLLVFRRPMKEGSHDRLSTCSSSETDLTEELSIEDDIAFKLLHHEETASQKLHRVAKGIQAQFAWSKDIYKERGSKTEIKKIQFKNHQDIVTFNPNCKYTPC